MSDPVSRHKLDLPARTNWRSPPFAIRFEETDDQDFPAKAPSRLPALIRSGFFILLIAIVVPGIVLISLYGVPDALQLPDLNSFFGQPAARLNDTTFEQQSEARFRRQRDAKSRQQKAAEIPR